jgi:hypothetical protein
VIVSTAASSRARRQTLLTLVATIAGLALFIWQVRVVGVAAIASGLAQVGAGFLLVLVLSLARLALRGAAWRALQPERARLTTTMAAVMAGDAVGNLTPLSVLVGEPAKAMYLSGEVGGPGAFAALTAENFFYSVSVAIYVVLGTAAMLVTFQVPAGLREVGIASLVLMAAILAGAAWMAWRRPSLVSAALAHLPVARLRRMVDKVRAFELQSYGSVGGEPGRLLALLFAETAFHVLSFVEVWLVLGLLTGDSLPLHAFVLDTFSRIVNVVFKVIPYRIGVEEYTSKGVAVAIGLSEATGLTLAIVRKGRMLVWGAIGLALYARRGLTSPGVPRSPSTS